MVTESKALKDSLNNLPTSSLQSLNALLPQSQLSQSGKVSQRVRLRRSLEQSQTAFTQFFFRARGEVFIPGDHHAKIDEALGLLERGKLRTAEGLPCNVLLVTVPPRFGKTQFIVIDWIARSLARNPRAKFIHLSYADDLALDNSAKARETVLSPEFQALWPVQIKADADSKKKWYTAEGGGVYATAAGGAVTGFGAGSLADVADEESKETDAFGNLLAEYFQNEPSEAYDPEKFYGAIIIDDPIKVDDASNEKERTKVNKRLNGTIKSRRNSRNTPMVIVMQRLDPQDMVGFVLGGGLQEPYHHLNLPAIVGYKGANERSLWPAKHTLAELKKMRDADYSVFMAQYMQDPTPEEGTFFKAEMFLGKRFRLGEEPTKLVKYGAGDYAVTEDAGDWTEQAIGGFDTLENLYFLDWHSARTTLDRSIDQMMQMVLDHDVMLWAAEKGIIRRAMEPYILKEQQKRRNFFKMEWLASGANKAVNAKAFQGMCAAGKVYIPYGQWGDELIAQLLKFTGKGGEVDDKVDVCGIFGRLLNQAFGPDQYHDRIEHQKPDYGMEDDDEYGYGNGTIPV